MKAQKIDDTTLKTFEIVIAAFLVYDKAENICFFKEIFLLSNISMDMALRIFFLTLSNADIYFTN